MNARRKKLRRLITPAQNREDGSSHIEVGILREYKDAPEQSELKYFVQVGESDEVTIGPSLRDDLAANLDQLKHDMEDLERGQGQ